MYLQNASKLEFNVHSCTDKLPEPERQWSWTLLWIWLTWDRGVSSCKVWGGQWGGHICVWGGGQEFRMTQCTVYDWVIGVIWNHLCDSTLWICNLAILQPLATNFIGGGGAGGPQLWQRGAWPPGHPLEALLIWGRKACVCFGHCFYFLFLVTCPRLSWPHSAF